MVLYALDNSCQQIPSLLPMNYAQVYTDSIISDTMNWYTISGSFIADSAYQYMIVGNHFDNEHTSYIQTNTIPSDCIAHYYIDDIFVGIDSLVSNMEIPFHEGVSIFPNPVVGSMNISISGIRKLPSFFSILDIRGIIVASFTLNSKVQTFDLSSLNNGVYIAQIESNGKVYNQKLIINH